MLVKAKSSAKLFKAAFKSLYQRTYYKTLIRVIEELVKMAKQIAEAQKAGEELGLSIEELAFYDALTKPQAVKRFLPK